MKILITGATGYIGKRLIPILLNDGHHLICTVRDIARIEHLYAKDEKIEFVENEIMNQLSYTVLADKIENIGFNFHGSLDKQIANTLNLFSAIKN